MQHMPNEILERAFAYADEDPEGGCGIIALVCADWRALVMGSSRLKRKRVDLGTLSASVALLRGIKTPMRWRKRELNRVVERLAGADDAPRLRALWSKVVSPAKAAQSAIEFAARVGGHGAWEWAYRCVACIGSRTAREEVDILVGAAINWGGASMLSWLHEKEPDMIDRCRCRVYDRDELPERALWLADRCPDSWIASRVLSDLAYTGNHRVVVAMREAGVRWPNYGVETIHVSVADALIQRSGEPWFDHEDRGVIGNSDRRK